MTVSVYLVALVLSVGGFVVAYIISTQRTKHAEEIRNLHWEANEREIKAAREAEALARKAARENKP